MFVYNFDRGVILQTNFSRYLSFADHEKIAKIRTRKKLVPHGNIACEQALSGVGAQQRERWKESLQRRLRNLNIRIENFDAKRCSVEYLTTPIQH